MSNPGAGHRRGGSPKGFRKPKRASHRDSCGVSKGVERVKDAFSDVERACKRFIAERVARGEMKPHSAAEAIHAEVFAAMREKEERGLG